MKLRSNLIALVIAAVLPVLIFAGAVVIIHGSNRYGTAENQLQDTSRAISLAIDRELLASIRALETLATSEHLDSGDLRKFYDQAKQVLKTNENWETILLMEPSGQQLIDLLLPFGSPMPMSMALDAIQEVSKTKRPVVSNLLWGTVSQKYLISFNVPVIRDGNIRYVLAASGSPTFLSKFLLEQRPSPDWYATIIDRHETIIAGTHGIERFLGKPAPLPFTTANNQGREGISRGVLEDGRDAYAAVARSELSGWTVGIAVPVSSLDLLARRSITILMLGGVVLVLMGIFLAARFGRRISRSIDTLSDLAAALGRGEIKEIPASPIDEVNEVAQALGNAAVERKRAAEIHSHLAAIVESSVDAIIGTTLDGVITSWNKGAEKLFGYSAEEMRGHSFMIIVPPDQIEKVKRNFEGIKRGERIDSYETIRLRKSGEPIHVSVTVSPVRDESGKIIGVSSITRDITERKRTERQIKALHDINLTITSTLDLPIVLELLLQKIDVLLPYAAAHIRLVNRSTGALEPLTCRNIDEEKWKSGSGRDHGPLARAIIESKKTVVISNLQTNERVTGKDFYRQLRLVSLLGLPLIFNDEAIGVLSVFTRSQHEFTDDEITFMGTLAKQASIAIHNSQLYEQSRKLTQDLLANERQIRTLIPGLINARDQEAERIARVLHDESGQLLATVYIALDELAKTVPAPGRDAVQKVKGLLDQIEERLRDLSHELHPTILNHLGLQPSLELLATQVSKRSGIHITTECALNGRLSPLFELTLYRVVQEALNNIVRHAKAKHVRVRLLEDEALIQCAVQDDGVGFDSEAISGSRGRTGLGLAGIRERVESLGGRFEILSAPDAGTKLLITIPQEKPNDLPGAAG